LDAEGNEIPSEKFNHLSKYQKRFIGKKEINIQTPNYDNLNIYRNRSGTIYRIYLDGPIGIGLFYDKRPIAVISFSLQDMKTLFIHQMQVISADHFDTHGRMTHQKVDPIVQTIPRQETLYDIVVLVAKKYGCKKILLQSGEKNKWTETSRLELQFDDEDKTLVETNIDIPHLSLAIAQQIYDTFAKKQ